MSEFEFAPEQSDWPAEADALATNIDFPDDYADSQAETPAETPDWEAEAFEEAARAYGQEHAEEMLQRVFAEQLEPLRREMEAGLHGRRQEQGTQDAFRVLAERGVAEADREEVARLTEEMLDQQLGEKGLTWDDLAQVPDEQRHALVDSALSASADAWLQHKRFEGADEVGMTAKYFGSQQTAPVPGGGDELSLVAKHLRGS